MRGGKSSIFQEGKEFGIQTISFRNTEHISKVSCLSGDCCSLVFCFFNVFRNHSSEKMLNYFPECLSICFHKEDRRENLLVSFFALSSYALKRFLREKGSGLKVYEGHIGQTCQNTDKCRYN